MTQDRVLWQEWRARSAKGASVDDILDDCSLEDLVWLLAAHRDGDENERTRVRDELLERITRFKDDARLHDETVRGLASENRAKNRAARAQVSSARSGTLENVRILENRTREKNVGARLRHGLRSVDDSLENAEARLGESDALDEALERTSRAFTERMRTNGRKNREREGAGG